MLTLDQFNKLSLISKLERLEQDDDSIYLEVFYIHANTKVCLFLLYGSYYVSVYYNTASDRIIKAEAFTDYSQLDAYLEGIDLSDVYALLG